MTTPLQYHNGTPSELYRALFWQDNKEYNTSTKYAWLPTDFHVDHDGSVRCLSYINNLHPIQHAAVYPLLERVVARFVPLFERVLTSVRYLQQRKVPVGQWYDEADREQHESEMAAKQAELGDDFSEDDGARWDDIKPLYQPLVPPYQPPAPPTTVLSLRRRRLQLIVKLADIILTPQQPHHARRGDYRCLSARGSEKGAACFRSHCREFDGTIHARRAEQEEVELLGACWSYVTPSGPYSTYR